MKPRTIILMVVAIGCGLAASYMTSQVIADRKPAEQEKVTVLVARQNIPMGTLIKDPERFFEEKQFTKGEEPKKAIRSFDQLKDSRLNKPLSAEQFVTPDDLTDKKNEGLAYAMRKGMRAVGIKVNIDTVAGGFVLPNSHVDIVSVVRRNDNDTYAKIILQDVLVLAVDRETAHGEDKNSIPASTVTVQVTPAQAEKLSLAMELGTLRLILRQTEDNEKISTGGVTPGGIKSSDTGGDDTQLTQADDTSRPQTTGPRVPSLPEGSGTVAEAPKSADPRLVHVMTIYNGAKLERVPFYEETPISKKPLDSSAAPGAPAVPAPVKE